MRKLLLFVAMFALTAGVNLGCDKNKSDGDTTDNLDNTSTVFDNEGRGPSVGVTLRVPIFSGGATQSRVRQSLATRDVRADQLEQQKRAVVRSTRNAYQSLLAGISEVEARRLALVSARSAYDASQVGLEVGTRTVLDVLNDVAEVRALHLALGSAAPRVPVSSIKGAVGHLMAAAGAIELAGALLAFEHDLLPGTAGHRDRDPECDLDIIGEPPRPARIDSLMSNSFGFGGQNCAVVLGRYA